MAEYLVWGLRQWFGPKNIGSNPIIFLKTRSKVYHFISD